MAQSIVAKELKNDVWNDQNREAVLNEAKSFAASCPRVLAPELDIHFWDEIQKATGATRESLLEAFDAMRTKRDQEEKKRSFESLHRDLGKAIHSGDIESIQTLIESDAPRLLTVERKRVIDPIQSMAGELDSHKRYLDSMGGRPFIGLTQKTLKVLDNATLGLRGLMLLAAAPNVGKTALAVQLGVDVVRNNPDACFLFLSLEMPRMEIMSRIKSRLAEVSWKRLVLGEDNQKKLFDKPVKTAEAEMARFGDRILILDERNFPNPTIDKVISQLERLKASTGAKRAIILIDYLQVWPVPASEGRNLRSDLDADKWRVGQMKSLRDATEGDAVLVISEARKPSGSGDTWAGEMADVMGSARGLYTPDIVFLFLPLKDAEIAKAYGVSTENTKAVENLKAAMIKKGIAHNRLKIVKGRDGVERISLDLTFWYHESRFEHGIHTDWYNEQ
jgi:KaiC/GvpD/RAD55 family RecA-like ATPase